MNAGDTPGSDVRSSAVEIVRRLSGAGHVAYFAGGCVRDRLMGLEPADYDVATDARPQQVAELFHNSHYVGESFGVTLVRRRGHLVHVATFRSDGAYTDGRRPDTVTFTDARHDAQRRDFTINGLFEDPLNQTIIDYVGGEADLQARMIRAIGDPRERLREDALRMLRAVRFAARFEFTIEPDTAEAITAGAGDLRGVSRERIGEELKRMLSHRNRAMAAWELQYLGLDESVLAEPHQTAAPRRLARLPEEAHYPTALAAWLLDREPPGQAERRARARSWGRALLLSNADQGALDACLEIHHTLTGPWSVLGVAQQKRLAARGEFEQALMLLQAGDAQSFVEVRRRVLDLARTELAPRALVTGEDLIGMGLTPGPLFRHILDSVYDAQLEGGLRDRRQALDLARSLARQQSPDIDEPQEG